MIESERIKHASKPRCAVWLSPSGQGTGARDDGTVNSKVARTAMRNHMTRSEIHSKDDAQEKTSDRDRTGRE